MAQDWRNVRVFISSTFRDMQAERDHLVRFVFPRLREELLKRRIHLVDMDLRWGVTSEQDALEACKEIIDECRPRFVCILGGRYGWTPPGREESITAAEIHYAVLHRLHLQEYRFFYFRDPRVTAAIPEAAARDGGYREFSTPEEIAQYGPDEAEERARRRTEKLRVLKQYVIDAGFIPYCYPARWDEAQKRLVDLKAFGDRVYADLLWSIDDELGVEAPPELDEFAAENAAMEAFVQERVAGYVVGSRQTLLSDLASFAEGEGQPNVLVLTGPPGLGKSALLAKFYLDYIGYPDHPAHPHDLVVPHFIGASPGSTDLRRTLRRLCHELAKASDLHEEIPLDLKELIQKFLGFLQQATATRRVVLLIDALNQMDAAGNAHAMYWLPYDLPENVRVIVSSLEHPALEALQRRGKELVQVKELYPLNEDDGLNIVCGFLQWYRKNLEADQIGLLICKEESGNPLYLLTALEELRTLGTYEEITQRIEELPGQVQELFIWIFQRLEKDPGFQDQEGLLIGKELVRDFASLMGVSRYGLSQIELAELLAPGDPEAEPPILPDPQGNVAALLRLLRPYLMQRGELLDFYHAQLREAVDEKYLSEKRDRLEAHQTLARYLENTGDPSSDGSWKNINQRIVTELPHHLKEGELWDNLIKTINNFIFVENIAKQYRSRLNISDFLKAIINQIPDDVKNNNIKILNIMKSIDWFSTCLELHFIYKCGRLDKRATCKECGRQSIIHGHIDMGGSGTDHYDHYISFCTSCFWSWFWAGYEMYGGSPEKFNYENNTY
ncbi:MAG: DUF4062 domain-containing protein [Thermodesulfobacteriota bacterium]